MTHVLPSFVLRREGGGQSLKVSLKANIFSSGRSSYSSDVKYMKLYTIVGPFFLVDAIQKVMVLQSISGRIVSM